MLVSGMIVGSLFTLFVVPSIYVLVARTRAGVPAGDAAPTVDPGRDLPVCETSPA